MIEQSDSRPHPRKFAKEIPRLSMVCLISVAALYAMPSQAQNCTDKYKPVLDSALKSKDIKALSRIVQSESIRTECSTPWLDSIRVKATQLVANEAENHLFSGDTEKAEKLLLGEGEATFALSAYWSVNAVLGDIARQREQWKQAAQQYGEAYELASVDSALASADAQRAQAIQLELFRLASESLRLGKDLSVAISRSGNGSGALSSRGFKPVTIPLPVTFEFNSAELSDEGLDQATLIANYVASQKLDSIALTGHTDWTGCAAYNNELSEKRASELAEAVSAAYENNTGTRLEISTQGLGESCPPVLSNSGTYTQAQREELARRVEIQLGAAPTAADEASCDLQAVVADDATC